MVIERRKVLRGLAAMVSAPELFAAAPAARAASEHPAQRWLRDGETLPSTDGVPQFHALARKGTAPTTVCVAADGRLWFTLGAGNAIGSMRPDGTDLREFPLPRPDSSPRIIASGADGNLWFTEHGGNRIGRLTPAGELTEFDLPLPASQPRAIALGADDALWFGLFAAGRIGRITPGGRITVFDLPTPDGGPRALAAGPDGGIWYSQFKANRVGRISPRGEITEWPMPRPNSGPGDITAGADGAMWLVELSGRMDGLTPDGARVARVTMHGEITEHAMPAEGPSPINIAVGPDRNIWYSRGPRLGRVTPAGEITEFPLGEGVRAVGLTAGSDREPPRRLVNRLYFADGAGDRIGWLQFSSA